MKNNKTETMLSKLFKFQKEVETQLIGMNIRINQLSTNFLPHSKKWSIKKYLMLF